MGSESTVPARFNGQTASGKARLETEALHFRGGDLKLSIPFKQMKAIGAQDGTLRVTFAGGTASFELGEQWTKPVRMLEKNCD